MYFSFLTFGWKNSYFKVSFLRVLSLSNIPCLFSRIVISTRGVNPYEKSCDFYKLFCVHSYSTKEAKVDKGVHLFF